MYRPRRWTTAEPHPLADELAARLKVSPLVAQVLLNRGVSEPDDCQAFLRPSLKALHDPASLPNLAVAAERIARAIRDREKVVIYGDYDVDGITATAILWHAIRTLGGEVECYVPHRLDEGYGLNSDAVAQICAEGAKLIVTVDCGVTAVDQARVAKERGVDLIITDHHEWRSEIPNKSEISDSKSPISDLNSPVPLLPDCFCIVHPRLPGHEPAYPNPALCGAGVAFKLAWGVGQAACGGGRVGDAFRDFLVEATALAALGTIADVVPLKGENRILAAFGLGGLKQSKLTGIKALIASAGLTGQRLDSYHVGFLLAPRLNACGRMGHARLAVQMLTEADEKQATETARYLEQQNRHRQAIERQILQQAIAQVEELKLHEEECRGMVLGAEGWHAGVIGIVASRLVDRFHKPAIMVALNDGNGQGSGRSITGFHLAQALHACGEHLDGYGGHEMAAGLKLSSPKFEDFRRAFRDYADKIILPDMLVPELKLEAEAALHQVTPALVHDLKRLGPFGQGNRKPLLCCRDVQVAYPPRRVGKTGDHLQIHVRQGDATMKCIAFNKGELFDRLSAGTSIHLAVEPTLNEYNGYVSVELEVKDVQFA